MRHGYTETHEGYEALRIDSDERCRKMVWKKGESGNPNGRPRKGKTFTELLELQMRRAVLDVDGTKRAGGRVLARLATEAVLTGQLRFAIQSPSGEVHVATQKLEPKDWIVWAKYIWDRTEGSIPTSLEVSGPDGGPVKLYQTVSPDDWDDDA